MLDELTHGPFMVGLKQTRKALKDGAAKTVFLARDAEARLVEPVEALCREAGVACVWVDSMARLGAACGIEVGAAAAASLR